MSSNAGINETKTYPLSDLLFSYFRNIFQHFLRNYDAITSTLEIAKTHTHSHGSKHMVCNKDFSMNIEYCKINRMAIFESYNKRIR